MDSTLQTSSISSSISEQKYINLRKRLDQFGYRQTLGIESLPLIEKLFNDLVHTTESLKKAKLEKSKNAADSMNTSLRNSSMTSISNADLITPSIQAYKADNAKLIKENNELHLQLIKLKDQLEVEIKDLKIKLGKSENENSDLRFLNTQYLHKLRSIEKESKDKSKKILDLQEKNFQAVIQTNSSSVNKQGSCFRRQRLDIDCMLPPSAKTCSSTSLASNGSSGSSGIGVSCASDPYVIDMIKLADDRISHLQTELENYKQSNEILNNKVSTYKTQVSEIFQLFFNKIDCYLVIMIRIHMTQLCNQNLSAENIFFFK